jgi:hypothetical protein
MRWRQKHLPDETMRCRSAASESYTWHIKGRKAVRFTVTDEGLAFESVR